jgi:hypothetical protein
MSDLFFSTASPLVMVEHFLRKFEAIPDGLWREDGNYGAHEEPCCAMGHCGIHRWTDSTPEADALMELIRRLPDSPVVIMVNDGDVPAYKQPTPKARILAALNDVKAELQEAA